MQRNTLEFCDYTKSIRVRASSQAPGTIVVMLTHRDLSQGSLDEGVNESA
jgi:hypothetical protein